MIIMTVTSPDDMILGTKNKLGYVITTIIHTSNAVYADASEIKWKSCIMKRIHSSLPQ